MNGLSNKLAALTHWLLHTRQHAPRLEHEAPAIQAALATLSGRVRRLEALAREPLAVGLYGHTPASKKALLKSLIAPAEGALWLRSGERKIDYFSHVHPAWHQCGLAVRFSARPLPVIQAAPLLLTLYREGEFARRLAEQASAPMLPADICNRLNALRPQAMPQPQPGMDAAEAMEMLVACQRNAPAAHHLCAEMLLEIAELLPLLRREARAQLLASLWGEDAALTAAWLRHAELLQQLGGATQALAPDSLLMNDAMCLASGARTGAPPDTAAATHLLPLHNGQPLAAQRVSLVDLAPACAEVAVQYECSATTPVDIIDIPNGRLSDYAERQLPDALLTVQPARNPEEAQAAAAQLAGWLNHTEAVACAAPRLIWAMTPDEAASPERRRISDSVQRALIRADAAWGVLQLFENEQAQQARVWLHKAVNDAHRLQRRNALLQACDRDADALFASYAPLTAAQRAAREQQVKEVIQHLQRHIDRHGDLLTALDLPPDLLQQAHTLFRQKRGAASVASAPLIDLFAETPLPEHRFETGLPDLADFIYRVWLQHLRQLTPAHPRLKSLAISRAALRLTGDLLIDISERVNLRARLRQRLAECAGCREAELACAAATISEFVTWLGYADTAAERRPRSKVVASAAIFAAVQAAPAGRLTQLTPQPLGQGVRWAYDWLVALYSRVQEASNEDGALNPEQYRSLQAALLMSHDSHTPTQ